MKKSLELSKYLLRLGFHQTPKTDFPTLQALHQAHVQSVPFENLDIQLGKPVDLTFEHCYHKIVEQRRGGWCYELNGLFGWALQEIGFDVQRISAGVMREKFGDARLGNHLCLLVYLDQPYLVDVGFGGSLLSPIPLYASEHQHPPYRIFLTDVRGGYWRFTEHRTGEPFSFDFQARKADEALLASQCEYLQSSPQSPFVQNLVVQRRNSESHVALRGRILTVLSEKGEEKTILSSWQQLLTTLRQEFGLNLSKADSFWPKICARHQTLFGK